MRDVDTEHAGAQPADDELLRRLSRWHHADSRDGAEEVCKDRPDLIEPMRQRMDRLQALGSVLDGFDTPHHDLTDFSTPETIGPYQIVRRVGEGANGVVYDATHTVTQKRVALKLLVGQKHASERARQRFLREAELGGQLDHPNVATVFDAGEVEGGGGVPYLAMQFVDGRRVGPGPPSDDEPNADGGPGPTLRETVTLFLGACRGVEHAHAKGLIHRDLKPANILVDDEGNAVVVDFGLAKMAGDATSSVSLDAPVRGTVAYASPEQCRDEDGDVRSDVYSLGVVLFEMVVDTRRVGPGPPSADHEVETGWWAGAHPTWSHPHDLDGTDWQVRQRIATTDARRLRSVDPSIDRDLDAIVGKALERVPNRRYATVSAFIDDLERWLHGRPVQARPATLFYLARKWIARHRGRVAVVAVVLLMIAGVAAYAASRVVQERDRARDAAAESEAVSGFLEDLLSATDPFGGGAHDVTVAQVLAAADKRIAGEFDDRPLIEARLRRVIGRTLSETDQLEAAEPHLRRAVALLQEHAGPDDERTLEAQVALSRLLYSSWRMNEAEGVLDEVIPRAIAQLGPIHPTTYEARGRRFAILLNTDRIDEAEAALTRLGDDTLRHHGEASEQHVRVVSGLASVHARRREFEKALTPSAEAHALAEKLLGPRHALTLSMLHNLGNAYLNTGDFERAVELYRDGAERRAAVYGPDHEGTWFGRTSLAVGLNARAAPGDLEEAIDILLDVRDRWAGSPPFSPTRMRADLSLMEFLRRTGRDAEADAILVEHEDRAEEALTLARPPVQWLLDWHAHLAETDATAADRFLARTMAAIDGTYGPDSPQAARIRRVAVVAD